jgi:hypothetical protein
MNNNTELKIKADKLLKKGLKSITKSMDCRNKFNERSTLSCF